MIGYALSALLAVALMFGLPLVVMALWIVLRDGHSTCAERMRRGSQR